MRTCFTLLLLLAALCMQAATPPRPVGFVENKGQWPAAVRFRLELPGGQLDLRADGWDYVFYDGEYFRKTHDGTLPPGTPLRLHGVQVRLLGATPQPALLAELPDETLRNYFLGNDESRWASGVKSFGEVTYKNIYPHIDLRLFTHREALKYEFIVHPGGDPAAIRLGYEGQQALGLETDGRLSVSTSLGRFQEMKPYTFQETKNGTKPVKSNFLLNESQVSFRIADRYDPALPLVIDPQLIFATFSGATADNWGHTATYDDAGNLYAGGSANGSGFPATAGAFQINFGGNGGTTIWDVAILKFNPTGTRLLYATYLGGSQTEIPHSLIVNKAGDLLILGTTSSVNFPTSLNAYDRSFNGGFSVSPLSGMEFNNGSDLFVARLNASGSRLVGSTYQGTSANDGLNQNTLMNLRFYGDYYRGEIVTDSLDNIYIATTAPTVLPANRPDQYAAAVMKFSPDLSTRVWQRTAVVPGFSGGYGLRVAPSGKIYVCGAVRDILTQPEDGFVARLAADGSVEKVVRQRTSAADASYLLDLDVAGNVYVYGLNAEGTYPVSGGVYSNRNSGQFIQAYDASLDKSLFSTVVGSGRGRPDLVPTAFLVSQCGNIYLAGWGGRVNHSVENSPLAQTSSTAGLPVTPDAFMRSTDGSNFYIALFETGMKSLLYATFMGNTNSNPNARGDHVDGGTCRFDKRGFIYHAACSCHPGNFPTTPGAWSATNNSNNCNNAAFKFDIDNLSVKFDIFEGTVLKDTVRACAPLTLRFVNRSTGGKSYEWNIANLNRSTNPVETSYTFPKAGEYTITLTGVNPLSCTRTAVYQRKIILTEPGFTVRPDTSICLGGQVQLYASGGSNYVWSPAAGLSATNTPNPVARPTQTTTYTVSAQAATGCSGQKSVTVTVQQLPVRLTAANASICTGQSVQLQAEGNGPFVWRGPGIIDSTAANPTVLPTQTSTYTVSSTDARGCRGQASLTITIDEGFRPAFEVLQSQACGGPASVQLRLASTGADGYTWSLGNGDSLTGAAPPAYVYAKPGTYTVSVKARRGSCTLTASQPVTIDPPLQVPNVITPNGDGKNDRFVIGPAGRKLEVFSRWGRSVFFSNAYQNDWSPTLPPGTYYYLITLPGGQQCKGWLTLML